MFKLFTVGALLYILYKITFPPKKLDAGGEQNTTTPKRKRKKINEDDYIEYDDVD